MYDLSALNPLLEEIDRINLSDIDWAIIGGESGHHYRAVEKKWVQSLIKQCEQQKVKVFFKQWGGFRPKSGGRTINGRMYSQYPKLNPMTNQTRQKLHKLQIEDAKFEKQQFKKLVTLY